MKSAVEGSLRRLKTDYIDLYLIHWPERNTNRTSTLDYENDDGEPDPDLLKTLEGVNEIIKEGKIR